MRFPIRSFRFVCSSFSHCTSTILTKALACASWRGSSVSGFKLRTVIKMQFLPRDVNSARCKAFIHELLIRQGFEARKNYRRHEIAR